MKRILLLLVLIIVAGCSYDYSGDVLPQKESTPEDLAKFFVTKMSQGDFSALADKIVDADGEVAVTEWEVEEMNEMFEEECGPDAECIKLEKVLIVGKERAISLENLPEDTKITEYYIIKVKPVGKATNGFGREFFDDIGEAHIVKVDDQWYFYPGYPQPDDFETIY
ncbi:hypothetical protein ACFLZB_00720 [Nanoarchaeota archaeon]